MRALIIGKKGQLASSLLERSAEFNFEVKAFGRRDINILNLDSITRAIINYQPDVVINTSGEHASEEKEKFPEQLFRINTIAVGNLAKSCEDSRIKFITVSSNYVFGGNKKSSYIESDIPKPIQWYGVSKLAGEISALDFCRKSYVIRTTGIFGGLHGSPQKGNFVLNIIRDARLQNSIEVNSEQITNVTFTNDLADAIFLLLKKKSPPGIYHVTNKGSLSWLAFAKEIVRYANLNVKIKGVDRKGISGGVRRPINSATSNAKLEALGITVPNWEKSLHNYLDYIAKNEK